MAKIHPLATHLLCAGVGFGVAWFGFTRPAREQAQALSLLCQGSFMVFGGSCNDVRESLAGDTDLNLAQLRLVFLKRAIEGLLDGSDKIHPFSVRQRELINEWKTKEAAREAILPKPTMPAPPPGHRRVVLPP